MHIYLVGLLQPFGGNTYLLTCVDRFTSWLEAVPIPDIAVETIAKAFVARWVTVFGAPSVIITDRGHSFSPHFSKWWSLKTPQSTSPRVGELSPAP